jgi:hypothetical protein
LVQGAIGLVLWLGLVPNLIWLLPFHAAAAFYAALGPLASTALLTWAVQAGFVRQREMEGRLVPMLGAGTLLAWITVSTVLSGGAWWLWTSWRFWLAILIPLLGYLAGLLIRQALRSLGNLSGLQWWLPHGVYLILGSLLWAALFPTVFVFVAFAVTG